jgi:hypothetical protein
VGSCEWTRALVVAGEQSLRLAGVLWVGADGGGGKNVDLSSLSPFFFYFFFFFVFVFFLQNPLTNEAEGKSGRKIIKMARDPHMTR